MQVQPISNQSFGKLKINPETRKLIQQRSSKVEIDAIERLIEKEANNPVITEISHSSKNKLIGNVGYIDPSVKLFETEESYGRAMTPYNFISKLCKKADFINEKKMDTEDIRLMASRFKK